MAMTYPLEKDEHIAVINYLHRQYPKAYVHHSANEGDRKVQHTQSLLNMGMHKGHPDIEVLYPNGFYNGLFIEMKRNRKAKGVKVSDAQRDAIDELNKAGYKAVVCYGFDDAKETIDRYMREVK